MKSSPISPASAGPRTTTRTTRTVMVLLAVAGLFLAGSAAQAEAATPLMVEPTGAERQLWNAVGEFGHELLQASSKSAARLQNMLISPLSVHLALSMALEGARGSTRDAMLETLKVKGLKPEALRHAYSGLTGRKHENTTQPGDSFPDVKYIMRLANRMYLNKAYRIDASYVDQLKTTYHADAVNVDFAAQGPAVQKEINEFVREKTNNLIPEILREPLDANTVLALVNAVYFKGDWTHAMHEDNRVLPFNKDSKEHRQDHSNWLNTVRNMMYLESAALRAKLIRIPYRSRQYTASMLIIVPKQSLSDSNQWLYDLKWADVQRELGKMQMTRVNLTMPRFEVGGRLQLEGTLRSMGMTPAFDIATSDLSGIVADKKQRLSIDQVIHEAKMIVTKYGTEAAAATVLSMTRLGYVALDDPVHMMVDRAFYVAILYGAHNSLDVMPLFNGVVYKV